MYAMEYTKQERAAPAAITIVIHLALIYVFAAGMGVVPSISRTEPFEVVTIPEDPIKPQPIDEMPLDPSNGNPDLSRFHNKQAPTIVIEQEPVIIGPGEPRIIEGGETAIVDEAFVKARILSSSEPMYPLVSRARDEEGTVLIKVMISPYGIAGDVQVEKSSGYPRLDEAAIKAVKSWRFAPAKRGSQAIATWVTVPVKFVLNARG